MKVNSVYFDFKFTIVQDKMINKCEYLYEGS